MPGNVPVMFWDFAMFLLRVHWIPWSSSHFIISVSWQLLQPQGCAHRCSKIKRNQYKKQLQRAAKESKNWVPGNNDSQGEFLLRQISEAQLRGSWSKKGRIEFRSSMRSGQFCFTFSTYRGDKKKGKCQRWVLEGNICRLLGIILSYIFM